MTGKGQRAMYRLPGWHLLLVIICVALGACQAGGGQTVLFDSADTNPVTRVSGKQFKPEGAGPFPAVVLLHTCGGADRRHVASIWPKFLLQQGYVAVTVASYKARGYTRCDAVPNDVYQWHQAYDAYGALEYLAAQKFVDPQRVAVVGFSAGGFAINKKIIRYLADTNKETEFRAAIALYAGCFSLQYMTRQQYPIPLLQIVAEKDTRLAASCIEAAARTPLQIHVIEGAYHAFDQPELASLRVDSGGNPMKYSGAALKEAKRVVSEFLAQHLR